MTAIHLNPSTYVTKPKVVVKPSAKSILFAEHDLLVEMRHYRSDKSEEQILRVQHATKTLVSLMVERFPHMRDEIAACTDGNELLDLAYKVSVL